MAKYIFPFVRNLIKRSCNITFYLKEVCFFFFSNSSCCSYNLLLLQWSQLKKVKTIDVILGQISHIGLRLTVCQPFLTVIKATDLCQMVAQWSKNMKKCN